MQKKDPLLLRWFLANVDKSASALSCYSFLAGDGAWKGFLDGFDGSVNIN